MIQHLHTPRQKLAKDSLGADPRQSQQDPLEPLQIKAQFWPQTHASPERQTHV
jgi:hypothetical protein